MLAWLKGKMVSIHIQSMDRKCANLWGRSGTISLGCRGLASKRLLYAKPSPDLAPNGSSGKL